MESVWMASRFNNNSPVTFEVLRSHEMLALKPANILVSLILGACKGKITTAKKMMTAVTPFRRTHWMVGAWTNIVIRRYVPI